MNFDRLRYVAERADVGQAREALLAVEIPEQPGSFLKFCEMLGQRAVTEFNYRYGAKERAQIFVGFALARGKEERDEVIAQLRGRRLRRHRHDRQRDGEAARALHGGRARQRRRRQRAALPLRISRSARARC